MNDAHQIIFNFSAGMTVDVSSPVGNELIHRLLSGVIIPRSNDGSVNNLINSGAI